MFAYYVPPIAVITSDDHKTQKIVVGKCVAKIPANKLNDSDYIDHVIAQLPDGCFMKIPKGTNDGD